MKFKIGDCVVYKGRKKSKIYTVSNRAFDYSYDYIYLKEEKGWFKEIGFELLRNKQYWIKKIEKLKKWNLEKH